MKGKNLSYTFSILQKMWYQHVWPSLQQEMRTQEVLAAVLQPVLYLIQESTVEEYESIILPSFRLVYPYTYIMFSKSKMHYAIKAPKRIKTCTYIIIIIFIMYYRNLHKYCKNLISGVSFQHLKLFKQL